MRVFVCLFVLCVFLFVSLFFILFCFFACFSMYILMLHKILATRKHWTPNRCGLCTKYASLYILVQQPNDILTPLVQCPIGHLPRMQPLLFLTQFSCTLVHWPIGHLKDSFQSFILPRMQPLLLLTQFNNLHVSSLANRTSQRQCSKFHFANNAAFTAFNTVQ